MIMQSVVLAAVLLLGFGSAAEAGFIASAAVAAIGLTGAAATIATGVVTAGIGFGLSYIAKAVRPGAPGQHSGFGGLKGSLEAAGTIARSFLLGRVSTAGSLIYANTTGNTELPNKYLVQVIALSDLPIDGIVQIWVNGRQCTLALTGNSTGSARGTAVPEFDKGGRDHLFVRFHDGTQTTADAYLTSTFGSAGGGRAWNANAIGAGVAYVIMTARANTKRKVWNGWPRYKFVCDGIPLYDLTQDTSVGGSGTHRWNTPSTWTDGVDRARRLAAVAIYNVIRGIQYNGSWFWGGQTVTAAGLPHDNWVAARNECDDNVTLKAGGSERRYEIAAEISVDEEPLAVLQRMARCCNARIPECGGRYKIKVGGQSGSSVLSFTDAGVVVSEGQSFDPMKGTSELVNGVAGDYLSAADGWVPKSAPPRINTDYRDEDGIEGIAQVSYDYVTSSSRAQRLMAAILKEARRERAHDIFLPLEASFVEPVDEVDWSSDRNGYVSKLFRPDWTEVKRGLPGFRVGLIEIDPDDYDWTAATDEDDDDAFPPLEIAEPDVAVRGFGLAGATLPGDGSRDRAGILMTWATTDVGGEPLDEVIGLSYEVRRNTGNTVVRRGQTPPGSFDDGSEEIGPLASATSYQVRAQYISSVDEWQPEWTSWTAVTTPDVRAKSTEIDDEAVLQQHIPVDEITTTQEDSRSASWNTDTGYIPNIDQTIPVSRGKVFVFLSFTATIPWGRIGQLQLWRRRNGVDLLVDYWSHSAARYGPGDFVVLREQVPMVDIGPQTGGAKDRRYRLKFSGAPSASVEDIGMAFLYVEKV